MLRDNLVGLIEPMLSSAGANPLALRTRRKKLSDDRPPCLENPRPVGAELTLTENAPSPFHAEPRHCLISATQDRDRLRVLLCGTCHEGCERKDSNENQNTAFHRRMSLSQVGVRQTRFLTNPGQPIVSASH